MVHAAQELLSCPAGAVAIFGPDQTTAPRLSETPRSAVGSQYRSATELLSISFRHSIDQRPMVGRNQTKNQSRLEQ